MFDQFRNSSKLSQTMKNHFHSSISGDRIKSKVEHIKMWQRSVEINERTDSIDAKHSKWKRTIDLKSIRNALSLRQTMSKSNETFTSRERWRWWCVSTCSICCHEKLKIQTIERVIEGKIKCCFDVKIGWNFQRLVFGAHRKNRADCLTPLNRFSIFLSFLLIPSFRWISIAQWAFSLAVEVKQRKNCWLDIDLNCFFVYTFPEAVFLHFFSPSYWRLHFALHALRSIQISFFIFSSIVWAIAVHVWVFLCMCVCVHDWVHDIQRTKWRAQNERNVECSVKVLITIMR